MKTYVGIDNGVTGSIGILDVDGGVSYYSMPVFKQQDYQTSKKSMITRIDTAVLMQILRVGTESRVFLERPYVNPGGMKATISAVRAFEAVLIVIELLELSYEVIASTVWQRELLPPKCRGVELKRQSLYRGLKLFPALESKIREQTDADGLLIAEWARRNNM